MTPINGLPHLEWELNLKGLKAPDELQLNTVTQQAAKRNPKKPKPTCHHCKKPGHYWNQCRQLTKVGDQANTYKNRAGNRNNNNNTGQTNSYPTKNVSISNNHNANNRNDSKLRTVCPLCETYGKRKHSTEKCFFGANAENRPTPRIRRTMGQSQNQRRDTQVDTNETVQAAVQTINWKHFFFTPELHWTDCRPLKQKLPSIPEVFWQQSVETYPGDTVKIIIRMTLQLTLTRRFKKLKTSNKLQ